MGRPSIMGEPVAGAITVLSLEVIECDGPPVYPGRGSSLESFDGEAESGKLLRDLSGRCFAGPSGGRVVRESLVDRTAQKGACRYYDRRCVELESVQRYDTICTSSGNRYSGDGSLPKIDPLMLLQEGSDGPTIESAIALSPGRPDCGPFRSVEHSELDAGEIGCPSHDSTERVYFARDGSLGDSADGGIARHLPDSLEPLSKQKGSSAAPSSESCSLSASMPSTDDDYVVPIVHDRPRGGLRLSYVSKLSYAGDLVSCYDDVTMLGTDAKASGLPEKLVPRGPLSLVVYSDIKEVHAAIVLAVIPSDVGQRTEGLDDDRDAMQLRVSRMEDVACHVDA